MQSIDALRNLGRASAEWLAAVDITSVEQLREMGSVEAYREVEAAGFNPSLNLLYALEAGLRDIHWLELAPKDKAALIEALNPDQSSKELS